MTTSTRPGLPALAAATRLRLPDLVDRVVEAICAEAGRALTPDTRQAVAAVVESAVDSVLASALECTTALPGVVWRARLRELGAAERRAGRDLGGVERAVRTAVRVVWHGVTGIAREIGVPPAAVVSAADGFFAFVDDLCAEARAGHDGAAGPSYSGRAVLLTELLDDRAGPDLATRAEAVGWPLPERVVAVVADRPFWLRPGRHDPCVLGITSAESTGVLVPADFPGVGDLTAEHPAVRFAIGPAVAVRDAHRSAGYATALLRLADEGIVAGGRVLDASDHLTELLAFSSDTPALNNRLTTAILAPLAGLSDNRRSALLRTLALWLRHRGDINEIARETGLHTQSVRHQLQRLRHFLGESAFDGDERFILRIALNTPPQVRERHRRRARPSTVD